MKFQEALAMSGDKRKRCKTSDWLGSLDEATVDEVLKAVAELPLNRVWRAVVVMGFSGSNDTWSRHFHGLCVCER